MQPITLELYAPLERKREATKRNNCNQYQHGRYKWCALRAGKVHQHILLNFALKRGLDKLDLMREQYHW
jgi:hypothetical protein